MALFAMRLIILDSLKNEDLIKPFSYSFFALNEINIEKPVFFQLILNIDNTIFRYGFEIYKGKIKSEWLFGIPNKRETYYFLRENQDIKINESKLKKGAKILLENDKEETLLRDNALFLTVLSAFNIKLASKIVFAISQIVVITGLDDKGMQKDLFKAFDYENMRLKICLLYTSPSPRDATLSRMPSSA